MQRRGRGGTGVPPQGRSFAVPLQPMIVGNGAVCKHAGMADVDQETAWGAIAAHDVAVATVWEFAARSGAERVCVLLDRGDARNVGDLCAAGDEESILKRFKQFADAGVTDLSVRLLPIGDTRDELVASKYRTREVIAELAKQVR